MISIRKFKVTLENILEKQAILNKVEKVIDKSDLIDDEQFAPAGAAALNEMTNKILEKLPEGESILVPSLSSSLNPDHFRKAAKLTIGALEELHPKIVDALVNENEKINEFIDNEISDRQEQTTNTLSALEDISEDTTGDYFVKNPEEANLVSKFKFEHLRSIIVNFSAARLAIEETRDNKAHPFKRAVMDVLEGKPFTFIIKENLNETEVEKIPMMTAVMENIENKEFNNTKINSADVVEYKTELIGAITEVITNTECLKDYKDEYSEYVDEMKDLFVALKGLDLSTELTLEIYRNFSLVLCEYRKAIMDLTVYINSVSNTLHVVVKNVA